MTARETTLGALTAADLGKRVAGGCAWGGKGGPGCLIVAACGCCALDPDTPVTVYDEEEA